MSSTGKQTQTKAEFHVDTNKDKNKTGDYVMHAADADKNKNEKTSITFEKKKEHGEDWNKDLNKDKKEFHYESKDVNKDKDWNKDLNKDKKEFHYESKDLNKDKDFNKDLHKDKEFHYESKDLNKDKDLHKDKEFHYESKDLNKDKDWNKDKNLQHDKDLYGKDKEKTEGESKGIMTTIKEKVMDVLGSGDNDKSKDKDVHMSANKESDKYGSSTTGVSGSGINKEKEPIGSAAYVKKDPILDRQNLGAEHREAGYDKQANIIPSKEKDAAKIDVHGSLYTSGAGSTTYKTNEAK